MIAFIPGARVVAFPLVTATIAGNTVSGGTVTAKINIKRDGTITSTVAGNTSTTSTSVPAQWASKLIASNIGDAYYVRSSTLSGSTSGFDTSDSWLQLNADRSFGVSRSSLGSTTGTAQIQIAGDPSGTQVLAAFNVSWTVTSSAG